MKLDHSLRLVYRDHGPELPDQRYWWRVLAYASRVYLQLVYGTMCKGSRKNPTLLLL